MAGLIRRRELREPLVPRGLDPGRMMRSLLGWDPFAEMSTLLPGEFGRSFVPDIDVKEKQDSYEFCADLPGVSENDIEISVTGNRVTISGKREEEETREGDRYYAYERSFGEFTRSFTLPEGADTEHVTAELKNGVLRVCVPKKPEIQPKRITIGRGSEAEREKAEKPEVRSKEAA